MTRRHQHGPGKGPWHGGRGESGGSPAVTREGHSGPREPPCKGPEGSWLLLCKRLIAIGMLVRRKDTGHRIRLDLPTRLQA